MSNQTAVANAIARCFAAIDRCDWDAAGALGLLVRAAERIAA